MSDQRIRGWCFTINNWTQEEYDHVINIDCRYLVVGKEVGEKGTPHLQGYLEWDSGKTFSATKKKISKRCHLEQRIATPLEASRYCKKENDFFEKGDIPSQGARTDLNNIRDQIKEGATNVVNILTEDPLMYHQYGRTLEKLEDVLNRNKFRTWMTEGIWITGPSGSGKSHMAFEGYDPKTHYLLKNDHGWWDGYNGQETVIINEYRGHIQYAELLELVDKWPTTVRRRGREPAPFLAKKVIVTSVLRPEEVYHNLSGNDTLEQINRRFKIIDLGQNCTEVPRG